MVTTKDIRNVNKDKNREAWKVRSTLLYVSYHIVNTHKFVICFI